MGVLALQTLYNSALEKQRRIQDLKRRVLELEDENPIALMEPDIEEFVTGGKYVNAIARNTLDEQSPDNVFQEQGDLLFSNDSAIGEKKTVLLFESPIENLGGIFLNLGAITTIYPLPSTSRIINSNFVDIEIAQILPFDPTTITWNNQNDPFPPAGTGIDVMMRFTWARINTSGSFRADSIPTTVKWVCENFGALPLFPGTVWQNTIALMISISHSISFNEPVTSGSVIISPETDVTGSTGGQSGTTGPTGDTGINSNSSFMADIGFGSEVKCESVPPTG